MKTSFPPPYNPENLPPPDVGYRYIGADEKPLSTDEVYQHSTKQWIYFGSVGSHEFEKAWEIAWTFRRRINSEDMNMPSPFAKPILKHGQTIVVRVHDSQALSHAVQQIAFEHGWGWPEGKQINKKVDQYGQVEDGGVIFIHWDKTAVLECRSFRWTFKYHPQSLLNKYLLLDARTDLGTLIDLLDEQDKAPAPPKVNGYEAQFKAGDTEVVFGCAKINLVLLEKAASLMGYVIGKDYQIIKTARIIIGGNRTVASIKLNSDVELKSSDIVAILDYVHNVIVKNKA